MCITWKVQSAQRLNKGLVRDVDLPCPHCRAGKDAKPIR